MLCDLLICHVSEDRDTWFPQVKAVVKGLRDDRIR
jgi:hypothetical protein